MKFKTICLNHILIDIYETALYTAVKKENIEIVKLLLTNDKIDVNIFNILIYIFQYNSKIHIFNTIKNIMIQLHSQLYN